MTAPTNRPFQEKMKIIQSCPIKIFSAGKGGQSVRFWYPYKLQAVDEFTNGVTEQCLEFMLDSAITNEEVGNEDVLEKAEAVQPDYVVPKDYLFDQGKTVESVREFEELKQDYSGSFKTMYPLQPEYEGGTDHADMLSMYPELKRKSCFVVGGLKDADPEKQIRALQRIRNLVGENAYIHGLGMGGSLRFIKHVRENPGLVDSVDLATPYHNVNSGRLTDKTRRSIEFGIAQGENTTTVAASFIESMLIQLNYLYSPYCEDDVLDDVENLETNVRQQSLSAV